MLEGLLPIGTVVLLANSTKKVMIIGLCQKGGSDPNTIWDYAGVTFPEGYLDSNKLFLFNNGQIDTIFAIGYQDAEELAFKSKADAFLAELRAGQMAETDESEME